MNAPFAPVDVARLEEARLAAVLAGSVLEGEPFAGGVLGWGGPGSWQNAAYGAGLAGPVSSAELDRLCAFYETRGEEPRIELVPFADGSLVEGLAARGFVVAGFDDVLFRALDPAEDLRALLPHGWPRDDDGTELTIHPVDPEDDAGLRLVADVAGSGFRAEGEGPGEVELGAYRRTARDPWTRYLLARFGDRPAAGGGLDVHIPLGTLFGVSTLPEYRRRGIQAALIVDRLERARAAGCRLVTIGSRPGEGTERNAIRLGFQVAYTKVTLRWPGPGPVRSPRGR